MTLFDFSKFYSSLNIYFFNSKFTSKFLVQWIIFENGIYPLFFSYYSISPNFKILSRIL